MPTANSSACWLEPHARLTVVPGTVSGQPAASAADRPTFADWSPIAKDLENTGSYLWRMPTDIPYQFFVRVEAADRAGNRIGREVERLDKLLAQNFARMNGGQLFCHCILCKLERVRFISDNP
mgnify:CR=1 FL=1